MYITNYLFVEDPYTDFFMMVDSKKFWSFSNYKLKTLSDVIGAQQRDYVETIRYTLFNLGNLCFSFFAQVFDENNILIQKLQSVWLGAFSIPFVYLMLKKYFTEKKSLTCALAYALFTHVFIYSVVFNRDPHVYLLYTIATYIIINHDTVKNGTGKLLLLFVLICGFRLEHGFFFLLFLLAYLWLKAKYNVRLKALVLIMVPIAVTIMTPFLFGQYQDNAGSYEGLMDRVDRTEASASVVLSNLPPGIKEMAKAVNSQIAPAVPFWRNWFSSLNQAQYSRHSAEGYFTPWRIMESVANVVWIYIWGVILVGLVQKKYKNVPIELNILFVVSFMLLMAASSSINARRTYCVYPIIFTYSVYLYTMLNMKTRRQVFFLTTIGLVGIYIMYFSFKGL